MHDPDGAHPAPLLPPLVAALLTFIATASVLVLEIAAGRLLAPYVGVSLTTYTGIIGAILAGIALGAWIGGRPPTPSARSRSSVRRSSSADSAPSPRCRSSG